MRVWRYSICSMWKLALLSLCLIATAHAADKLSAPQLIDLAKSNPAGLRDAITASFDAKDLKEGTAWAGHGPDFFFATEAATPPALVIEDAPAQPMQHLTGSDLWYAPARIEPVGKLHSFHYLINGAKFGGRLDLPAFGPLSYLQPGVPSGTLSAKMIHTSKIYDGMKSEYWIYVPAQYDPKVPSALMVFQDGGWYIDRNGNNPALNVLDNLIAQKKIPVMIAVFINPGDISESPGTPTYNFVKAYSDKWKRDLKDSMRSTLYDTVSDRYPRFLRDEVLAEVGAKYNLRKDAYSHAITGLSSGGICAFNAAWQMPDQLAACSPGSAALPASSGKRTRPIRMVVRTIPKKCCGSRNAIFGCGCKTDLKTWRSATAVGRWRTFASPTPSSCRITIFTSVEARARTTPARAPLNFPRRCCGSGEIMIRRRPNRSMKWNRPRRRSRFSG